MPLKSGSSNAVVSSNISELMRAGHKQSQAVAIALKQAGRSNQHAEDDAAPSPKVRGVETFAPGVHRGQRYTDRDMRDMVRNFRAFYQYLKPPAVIGHEEDQELLQRSDLPAAAWISRLYPGRDGKLLTDMDEMAPRVAQLIRGKAYRKVSAEVYDEPPEGLPRDAILREIKARGRDPEKELQEATQRAQKVAEQLEQAGEEVPPLEYLVDEELRKPLGKMLRRVALLGGDLPQLKTLADIPAPEFAERFGHYRATVLKFSEIRLASKGSYHVFSEVRDMDRDAMIEALAEMGMDKALLEKMDDPTLTEVYRACSEKDKGPDEYSDEEIQAMTPEEKKAMAEKYKAMACKYEEDPENKEPMGTGYDARQNTEETGTQDAYPKQMPGGDRPGAAAPMADTGDVRMPSKTTVTHQFSEQDVKRIVSAAVAEVRKEFGPIKQDITRFKEANRQRTKRERIQAFCERYRESGHIAPAELDETAELGTLVDELMLLDDRTVVRKFKDAAGKTVEGTALDLAMARITRRQPRKFAEKVGTHGQEKRGKDANKEDRKAWAERITKSQKFSEACRVAGVKPQTLIENAEAATPDEFESMQNEWEPLLAHG